MRKGIHNLRHTYAQRLRAAGVPEEDRNALLGHSNASLSQHYALPDIERLQEMSEKEWRPQGDSNPCYRLKVAVTASRCYAIL